MVAPAIGSTLIGGPLPKATLDTAAPSAPCTSAIPDPVPEPVSTLPVSAVVCPAATESVSAAAIGASSTMLIVDRRPACDRHPHRSPPPQNSGSTDHPPYLSLARRVARRNHNASRRRVGDRNGERRV